MSVRFSDEGHRQVVTIAGLSALLFLVLLASFVRTLSQSRSTGTTVEKAEISAPQAVSASDAAAGVVDAGDDGSDDSDETASGDEVAESPDWRMFHEPEHRISLELPASWRRSELGASAESLDDVSYLVFEDSDTGARIGIGIWQSDELAEFSSWQLEAAPGLDSVDGRKPVNSLIAGREALVAWSPQNGAQPAEYAALIDDSERYFRFSYSADDNGAAMSVFVKALVSLSLDGEDSLDTIPPLPMPNGDYFPSRLLYGRSD
jgi:hypothetical protein